SAARKFIFAWPRRLSSRQPHFAAASFATAKLREARINAIYVPKPQVLLSDASRTYSLTNE
ncbi:MAG: hypothetical protein FWD58_09370, partial [Firmicutes bacterium]|nr:hypothetical protein [Bacillota bacterium]